MLRLTLDLGVEFVELGDSDACIDSSSEALTILFRGIKFVLLELVVACRIDDLGLIDSVTRGAVIGCREFGIRSQKWEGLEYVWLKRESVNGNDFSLNIMFRDMMICLLVGS